MKIAIILNGISRKKSFFYASIHPQLQKEFDVQVFETQHQQHARQLAARAVEEGFEYILAAGGDGTLNQVLNGILINRKNKELPCIGIIPLGTGNDFARTCNLKASATQICELLKKNNPRPTDVGKINCHDERGLTIQKYFINVCSLGMGPEVVKRLQNSNRSLGPTLTYLKAITSTFFFAPTAGNNGKHQKLGMAR